MNIGQIFENEHFHITVLTTPGCKAVVDNAAKNTCACFNKFTGQYSIGGCNSRKDAGGNIRFANCGNGQFTLRIKKNPQEHIDQEHVNRQYRDLMDLIAQIFNKTDHVHIKRGALRQALSLTPDGHTLDLYRGVPAHLGQTYFPDYYTK